MADLTTATEESPSFTASIGFPEIGPFHVVTDDQLVRLSSTNRDRLAQLSSGAFAFAVGAAYPATGAFISLDNGKEIKTGGVVALGSLFIGLLVAVVSYIACLVKEHGAVDLLEQIRKRTRDSNYTIVFSGDEFKFVRSSDP